MMMLGFRLGVSRTCFVYHISNSRFGAVQAKVPTPSGVWRRRFAAYNATDIAYEMFPSLLLVTTSVFAAPPVICTDYTAKPLCEIAKRPPLRCMKCAPGSVLVGNGCDTLKCDVSTKCNNVVVPMGTCKPKPTTGYTPKPTKTPDYKPKPTKTPDYEPKPTTAATYEKENVLASSAQCMHIAAFAYCLLLIA